MSEFPELSWEQELENEIRHRAILLAEKMDNMKECQEVINAFENVPCITPRSEDSVSSLPKFTDKPNWTIDELHKIQDYLANVNLTHKDLSTARKVARYQIRARNRGRGTRRLRDLVFGRVVQRAVSRSNKKAVRLQVFILGLAYGIPKKEIVLMLKRI